MPTRTATPDWRDIARSTRPPETRAPQAGPAMLADRIAESKTPGVHCAPAIVDRWLAHRWPIVRRPQDRRGASPASPANIVHAIGRTDGVAGSPSPPTPQRRVGPQKILQ